MLIRYACLLIDYKVCLKVIDPKDIAEPAYCIVKSILKDILHVNHNAMRS